MERKEADAEAELLRPTLPVGRVKWITLVDRDIKKVTSDAVLLIAAADELFLGFLAVGAHAAAAQHAVCAPDIRATALQSTVPLLPQMAPTHPVRSL